LDEYVLPDVVPVGGDDEKTVEHKVQDTISLARMLYRELPPEKQRKAVPVVQGQTKQQVVDCLDAYAELDNIQKIGFGSFSTGGVNGGVNQLTTSNIELLQFVVREAQKYDLNVHAFGIGGPTSVPILYSCGVDTFDSTSWVRSAGYGNVFFPFRSRVNISHLQNRSGATMFESELSSIKQRTGHSCPFCASFDELKEDRNARLLHNLIVMHEVAERVQSTSVKQILEIMNPNSRYRTYLEKMALE
jgi:tRNA-guanine family transglycosylase